MNLNDAKNLTVLITGASGGIGTYLTREFARRGANLALVAYPGVGLEDLKSEAQKTGCKAIAFSSDLRENEQCHSVVEQVLKEFGRIDILINNAGVEFTSFYHELPEDTVRSILRINLEAPMILTHLVLPTMLAKKSGCIINMSSLAGKSFPAFQEPYAATKAGLVGFTSSLRATYAGTGVSASVICPGFVEAGIYERLKQKTGFAAPASFGTSQPQAVVRAVIRAIERDVPEIIVNPIPVRPLLALTALLPGLGEWLVRVMGAHKFFRRVRDAEAQRQTVPMPSPAALPASQRCH
jgi:short-subunit dehydrogenase